MNPILNRLNAILSYRRVGIYFLLCFSSTGFLLAITQALGESRDYANYDSFLDLLRMHGMDIFIFSRFEPGFTITAFALTALFSSNLVVYSVLVSGAMFLKGVSIYLFSWKWPIFLAVAIFYFTRYFPIHELTQLRAASSAAFLLIAFAFLWNGNRVFGLLACMIALLFHLSAALVIPVLFIRPNRRWAVLLLGAAVFIATTLAVRYIISTLESTFPIVALYQQVGFGDEPNPLSSALLLDWFMLAVGFIIWDRISLPMKQVLFIELIGMAVFYGAIDFAVIAHRVRELYSVFWVIFVAQGLQLGIIVNLATASYVFVSACLYLYLYIVRGQFFS